MHDPIKLTLKKKEVTYFVLYSRTTDVCSKQCKVGEGDWITCIFRITWAVILPVCLFWLSINFPSDCGVKTDISVLFPSNGLGSVLVSYGASLNSLCSWSWHWLGDSSSSMPFPGFSVQWEVSKHANTSCKNMQIPVCRYENFFLLLDEHIVLCKVNLWA